MDDTGTERVERKSASLLQNVLLEDANMNRWTLPAAVIVVIGAFLLLSVPKNSVRAQDKQPRFPQLQMDQLNDQQRPLAEQIMKVSSVGLGGPYNTLLRSPVLGERMFSLLDYLRFNTSVPRRLNEFAILIQARLWTSQVEWGAHYPLAIKAGLSEAVAEDLKRGKRPASMQPDEAVVYDFCTEASSKRGVSDATFQRARQIFSEQQIVDLTMVSGTYASLAMLLDVAEQGLPPGRKPPLERLPSR
jgi:4-carboxymuconolactone decarboxylase